MDSAGIRNMVSTIIPVHDRPVMLREAVLSVLAQSHRPIEIIVVDDGSGDETRQAADLLAAQFAPEMRVLHQENAGPGLAREGGRRVARGEFIQYLDSDDLLLARKFEWQIESLREYPDCGVSYGKTNYRISQSETRQQAWKRTGERIGRMFPSFLESRWWGTSTPLYRKSVTDQAGPWLALSSEEDWEYDCRIAALGVRLSYVPEFVSEERDHSEARLSRGGGKAPEKLRDRATAHARILDSARKGGVRVEQGEMQHFARELFLLSRQCGAAGLPNESRNLFVLAKEASGAKRAAQMDFRLYEAAASILGWSLTGSFACAADRLHR